jgi:hypothetical protein
MRARSFFILGLQTTVLRHFGCGRYRLPRFGFKGTSRIQSRAAIIANDE